MLSPVTGQRKGSTTKVRCIDLAALVAAAVLRKNPSAEVLPFESHVVKVNLNPRDSVMTNAQ
jgi:60 kDa SS-A/Ro ribonucleoprotein